ncbi:MAG: molecular chaperone HtpG [Defluviitaleaceae bacterium]|nr:molecular chaperone HtpG [Defluviitaleaceae bacterium]
MQTGNLSIHSENILPIIKKWLYSDQDIFVRELISNGVDAITKLKKLRDMGEAEIPEDEEYTIRVGVDKENKEITIEDNGIGMTAAEVEEYINQIAFSGASAFMEKYRIDTAENTESKSEIIGHFGLGFYSSFMVAEKVQIDTLSFREGAEAVRWDCEGGIEYTMSPSGKTTRGTIITLHVGDEGEEFLDEFKLRGIIAKHCGFMPVPIYLENLAKEEEPDDTDIIDADEEPTPPPVPTPINDTHPLWLKPASECTDEDYRAFYQKVFMDFKPPLFWIHLNMDYPFRLKGILYFPSLKHDPEYMEGQVKLFNNQVYVADNIKEVIPEYLLLLKGVMDCPDLPLNVSRSFLQNDSTVKKMAGYISRKVADKLNGLCKKDREAYNGYWDDISPFIKYGCIKERDFYDKLKASILYKTISGEYLTLEELTEKTGKTVYYVTDAKLQSQYVNMFNEQGLTAIELTTRLDNPFISYLEMYENEVKFLRIDSDLTDALKGEGEDETSEDLQAYFRKVLTKEKLGVKLQSLKSEGVSAVILLSEQSRRMQEMSKMFGGGEGLPPGMFEEELTLVLNSSHSLVKLFQDLHKENADSPDVELIAKQLYDLAMLSHKPLENEQMKGFIERSNKIMEMAAKK